MKFRELFNAKGLPVMQNRRFPDEASARACPRGDISLVQDMETGLVYNNAFDPSLVEYGAGYESEPACSGAFRRHLEEVKEIIQKRFSGRSLVEIGCGKGYFLEQLRGAGFSVNGVDPSYEGSSPDIIKARFSAGLGISGDGAVLRHVLEHVADPVSFLREIAAANGGKGLVYIEVPCFDWICGRRAWMDIFYEHVNYFRLSDFRRMFGEVLESGHLFGGQFLYVVADLAGLRDPVMSEPDPAAFPADFLAGIGPLLASAGGKHKAVWGAASRGVIFALYMERAGCRADLAVDIDPAKQGKYLAASGLRVLSPAAALPQLRDGDDIFVMNSNYLKEIVELSGNRFNYIRADHYEL